jgi:hypothetical protein
MKKWLFTIGLIILFLGAIVFYNKLYYPTLPMESINKKEVIEKLNDSNEQIVKLSDENGYEWYIISERNKMWQMKLLRKWSFSTVGFSNEKVVVDFSLINKEKF